jgi:uncharacterized protein (DUF1697 family)
MARYAAFLRGINIGNRKASGEQLRSSLEAAGFEDPASFRASGNVVFSGSGATPAIASKLEKAFERDLGFKVVVFVRTAAQVKAIAAHEPFPKKQVEKSKGKLQVALLAKKPSAKAKKELEALSTDEDRLAVNGSEVYWLPSGGIMESTLGQEAFNDTLGSATVRTKGTMEQLAAKFFAD